MNQIDQDTLPTKSRKKYTKTTAVERAAHVQKWRQSQLKMSEFCRQHHLPVSNLSEWAKQFPAPNALFKQLVTKRMPEVITHVTPAPSIEIVFNNKIKVRLPETASLDLIINLVKELS